MNEGFEDPHKKLQDRVDKKLDGSLKGYPSVELEKVYDNLQYTKQAKEDPIKEGEYAKEIFGFETVNMSYIEKDNIYNRSIFSTGKICRMFLSWHIDQLLKYQRKKRKITSKMAFLLILIAGGGFVIVFIILLLSGAF